MVAGSEVSFDKLLARTVWGALMHHEHGYAHRKFHSIRQRYSVRLSFAAR